MQLCYSEVPTGTDEGPTCGAEGSGGQEEQKYLEGIWPADTTRSLPSCCWTAALFYYKGRTNSSLPKAKAVPLGQEHKG